MKRIQLRFIKLTLTSLIFIVTLLSACKKEEEKGTLIGKWKHEGFTYPIQNKMAKTSYEIVEPCFTALLEFKEGGTLEINDIIFVGKEDNLISYCDKPEYYEWKTYNGSWNMVENTIYINSEHKSYQDRDVTIKKLTKDKLSITNIFGVDSLDVVFEYPIIENYHRVE